MTPLPGTVVAAARLVAGVPSLPRARLVLETAHEIDRLVVDDGVRADLVWVRMPARAGPPVVVVTAQDAGRAVSPARVLARLAAAGPDRRWTTNAAGVVRWTGPAVRARGDAGGLAATATNDLQAVDVDGHPAVLKVYRVLGSDHGEGRMLAALGDGYTPRPLAQITYRPPGAGSALPLALVTERIPGRTLDDPLRESLRDSWSTGRPRLDPGTETALTRVRSALTGFHAALDRACGPRVAGDPRAVARVRREALRAEIRALARDGPAAVAGGSHRGAAHRAAQTTRTGIRAVLAATAAAVSGSTPPDTAPAHGDLHLAHVLLGRDRVSFVDVAQPGPGGSPADDRAALRRAVECMALDVLVDRAAAAHYGVCRCAPIQQRVSPARWS